MDGQRRRTASRTFRQMFSQEGRTASRTFTDGQPRMSASLTFRRTVSITYEYGVCSPKITDSINKKRQVTLSKLISVYLPELVSFFLSSFSPQRVLLNSLFIYTIIICAIYKFSGLWTIFTIPLHLPSTFPHFSALLQVSLNPSSGRPPLSILATWLTSATYS